MAESARINQFLAESANSDNGFHRLLMGSQRSMTDESIYHKADLSEQFRLGSIPKMAISALSAKLWCELVNELKG